MGRTQVAISLTLLLAASPPVWARARPAWVIPDALNVRKAPSTDSDRVDVLTRGTRVQVVSFREDRWCRVVLPNGRTGWAKEEYLEFSADKGRQLAAGESIPKVVPAWVEPSVANVRKGPDVGDPVVTQVKRGDKLYVVARNGDWRKVKTPSGAYGWIRSDLLEFDAEQGRQLAAGDESGAEEPKPAWVKANVVNVRKGPSEAYPRLGQLTRGDKVYALARSGAWVKCKGPDCTGWVHGELLETDVTRGRALAAAADNDRRDKAYCVGNTVKLRAGPGTDEKILGEVREGTTLWILGERNGWCRVQVEGGSEGWMAGWYVRRHGARTTVSQPPAASAPTARSDFPSPTRTAATARATPFMAWIAQDHTNVRYGPGMEKEVKLQLDKHTPVQVVDCEGQWCKIRTESGATGWAAGWVLDFRPPGKPEPTKVVDGEPVEANVGWVNRPTVNVRSGPSTEAEPLFQAQLGTELVIIGQQADWFKVALDGGKTGWIAKDLVRVRAESNGAGADFPSPTVSVSVGESSSSVARAMVREAMSHLGKPYVRGAEGPDAFDCSGFTSYVAAQCGISLPRTTSGQFLKGRPVSRDDLMPGDIVLFRNTHRAGISHVGLYIGQGRFIHAGNSRTGVKISSLDEAYYASRYAGARRVH